MPVIPFPPTLAFDPDHVHAMLTAFETVRKKLKVTTLTGDRTNDLVAVTIVDLARAGERNADVLTQRALFKLRSLCQPS
jgi:hypothetical protein